jgi:hypothetical protein
VYAKENMIEGFGVGDIWFNIEFRNISWQYALFSGRESSSYC